MLSSALYTCDYIVGRGHARDHLTARRVRVYYLWGNRAEYLQFLCFLMVLRLSFLVFSLFKGIEGGSYVYFCVMYTFARLVVNVSQSGSGSFPML